MDGHGTDGHGEVVSFADSLTIAWAVFCVGMFVIEVKEGRHLAALGTLFLISFAAFVLLFK